MQLGQIEEEIKKIVSFSLYNELRDPAFLDITVTRVKVSRDLQFADVRFTSMDNLNPIEVIESKLNHASGAFRGVLARKIKLRKIPKIRFHYDMDILQERKIEDVLKKIHQNEESEQV